MEDWLLATLACPPVAGEAASAALFSAGAGGVWEDYPDGRGRLVFKAGFAKGEEMRLMAELPEALGRMSGALALPLTDFCLSLELRAGEDFGESWKKDLAPIVVSPSLAVSPSWWEDALPLPPVAAVLRLDPGSAFGSGHHPTTFLCLALLCRLVERGLFFNRVLDLGAGSGILALSAALLLPKARVRAIDDDPETLFAISANVALNGLGGRLAPEICRLSDVEGEFDLIMANITRNALVGLSGDMAARSGLPGRLILSGILSDQAEAVTKAFAAHGFALESHLGQAEWSALSLARGLQVAPAAEREIVPEDQGSLWREPQDGQAPEAAGEPRAEVPLGPGGKGR
ncbi:MAG: 50S ribosomal protein L11 methyltransferase [Deltaproteobacteria bacterium]|jgi:ribosomal protein L11 methyltransferase|nr:50S ribosomal protein L11 methyltransferase [Deltaproteobacteria bacterium]